MIISKTVQVTVNNNMLNFYREHGFPNCKRFDKIEIPIELLGPTSKIDVEYECDYCHNIFTKAYGELILGRKYIQKDCCNKCKKLKIEEVNLLKYGVKTNLCLEENKQKSKQTIREKYGVDNVMQNQEIRKKQQQTIFEHYGVYTPICNPEIKRKIINTRIQRYGVDYIQSHLPVINGVFCSKAQIEICKYFNFEINALVDRYCVDGLKGSIIIEYNGSGHDLDVQKGKIEEQDFKKKELIRISDLTNLGYSLIIIENRKNKKITQQDYLALEQILQHIKFKEIIYYEVGSSTTIENLCEQSKF